MRESLGGGSWEGTGKYESEALLRETGTEMWDRDSLTKSASARADAVCWRHCPGPCRQEAARLCLWLMPGNHRLWAGVALMFV